MNDIRTNFDEAIDRFKSFLHQQGWSESLLWLTKERITGHRRSLWIFRPDELTSDIASRQFYEHTRKGNSSIRIDALCQLGTRSLVYVEDYGGDSKLLNFGTHQSPWRIRTVSSLLAWHILRLTNRIRGESSFAREMKITEQGPSPYAKPEAAE